jgi:hypothetical protein
MASRRCQGEGGGGAPCPQRLKSCPADAVQSNAADESSSRRFPEMLKRPPNPRITRWEPTLRPAYGRSDRLDLLREPPDQCGSGSLKRERKLHLIASDARDATPSDSQSREARWNWPA